MKLDSSVAAVGTGGASGLGKATVQALRNLGVKVAIFDFNAETGEAAAKETGATFCQVNVMDEASVDAGFAKARAANGQERILSNIIDRIYKRNKYLAGVNFGIVIPPAGYRHKPGDVLVPLPLAEYESNFTAINIYEYRG